MFQLSGFDCGRVKGLSKLARFGTWNPQVSLHGGLGFRV